MTRRNARNETPEMFAGAVITALVHIGFVVLLVVFGKDAKADAEPVLVPVIATELLMWGEVMPTEGELPWIANPEEAPEDAPTTPVDPETPTAAPEEEAVVLNPQAAPVEPQREELRTENEPRPENAQERPYRGETNPNRPTNSDPIMGSSEGFIGGTSLSETAMRNQFSEIQRQLNRALRRPATITEDEFGRLSADVDVRITESGQVTSFDIVRSSGNASFDGAVEAALNTFRFGREYLRINTVSNEELRASMVRNGFRITVSP